MPKVERYKEGLRISQGEVLGRKRGEVVRGCDLCREKCLEAQGWTADWDVGRNVTFVAF